MKKIKIIVIILVLISIFSCNRRYVTEYDSNIRTSVYNNSWNRYIPSNMKQISKEHFIFSDSDSVNYLLYGIELPYKVRLYYSEDMRYLPEFKKEMIHYYFVMKKINPEHEKLFEKEILFTEGNKRYWIAVQKVLLQELQKYCKFGDMVDVYINCIGAIRDSLHIEGIYLLNRFDEL